MAQEIELKLLLDADHLPQLLHHPLLAAHTPQRKHLRNTYFDTPALTLTQQRVALRERTVGKPGAEQVLLTVKTAGHSVGGLSRRGEWEAPTTPGHWDFAALVDDSALAAQLSACASQLVPVFRTDFVRLQWHIHHAGADLEVALDQGFIAAGEAREALLELELELRSGPEAALLDWAAQLAATGPTPAWLHASDRSKAERGFALFQRAC
ncbi:MAG: hypothetical protein RLZZ352_302 [Pseudomonadota bacterium]|jgi:inorganic triphosphatase YgiF